MKMKLQNIILLTLALSLTACGTKLVKSSQSGVKEQEDITRPPAIAASTAQDSRVRSNPDETVSFEEWSRKNDSTVASTAKESEDLSFEELKKQSEAAGKDTVSAPDDDLTFEEWKKLHPLESDAAK